MSAQHGSLRALFTGLCATLRDVLTRYVPECPPLAPMTQQERARWVQVVESAELLPATS